MNRVITTISISIIICIGGGSRSELFGFGPDRESTDCISNQPSVNARPHGGPTLRLVSARDQIPGSILRDQLVYADRERIYLGTYQGTLFVLARDRAMNFPIVQTIYFGAAVTAVRGDGNNLFVIAGDGNLRTFTKTTPLTLLSTTPISEFGLDSIAALDAKIYVSTGQAEMAIDQSRAYVSALNAGEVGMEVKKGNLTGLMYGEVAFPFITMVYDRKSGETVGSIPNPPGGQVALCGDRTRLFQTTPGCCGTGIYIWDKSSLALIQAIGRPGTNTVATAKQFGNDFLISGTEGGAVELFDLERPWAPLVASIDLREQTGHTQPEDIEIRALWADGLDDLVFAGSTWGNGKSSDARLPSFFVLELGR